MPPSWAMQPELFKRAVGLFIRNYGKKPSGAADWGVITGIYRKLGGTVSKKTAEDYDELDAIFEMIKEKCKDSYNNYLIDEMYEELKK